MEEKEKPRLARLTAILIQLQSKRVITASQLAERHQVSVRTIYRDIRTLQKSGIPIVSQDSKGYSIIKGYYLPPVRFTEEEANALVTAERLIIKNKDQSFSNNVSSAIEKIKAILQYAQKGSTDLLAERIYFGGNNNLEKTSDNLMEIQSSITRYQVLKIDYRSSENIQTTRNVEPFGLYSINGDFLLIAYCRLRNSFRNFRIDFIENLFPLDETFTPHDMTIQQYFENYIKS